MPESNRVWMSKNKSKKLARSAGGNKVFPPEIRQDITKTEKQKTYNLCDIGLW